MAELVGDVIGRASPISRNPSVSIRTKRFQDPDPRGTHTEAPSFVYVHSSPAAWNRNCVTGRRGWPGVGNRSSKNICSVASHRPPPPLQLSPYERLHDGTRPISYPRFRHFKGHFAFTPSFLTFTLTLCTLPWHSSSCPVDRDTLQRGTFHSFHFFVNELLRMFSLAKFFSSFIDVAKFRGSGKAVFVFKIRRIFILIGASSFLSALGVSGLGLKRIRS